ncbi:MAG: SRPBCC family protein [Deltaproteobacteria bacterium]|nr:SRPBCC family protein [Deltaproteobacteria bacterium]
MKKLILVLGVVVAAVFGLVMIQSPKLHVERSAVVPGAPAVAYGLVANFKGWQQWSPWDNLDPAMERTYSGAEAGQGAVYGWTSKNDQVGEGRMTITEAKPDERIEIKLEFIRPFADVNTIIFTFAPEAEGTKVTWIMDGDKAFMEKAMGLFMNMDEMIGTDFEKGLNSMKDAAGKEVERLAKEAEAKAAAEAAAAAAAAAAETEGGAEAGAAAAAGADAVPEAIEQ